jgi:hypothetical protein
MVVFSIAGVLLSGFRDSDEIAIREYNPRLQSGAFQGGWFVAVGVMVGTFFSFLLGIFNPYVVNKAGPDWMWTGGRDDFLRNLYFKPNGSFRRFGRVALVATLTLGPIAVHWLLLHL